MFSVSLIILRLRRAEADRIVRVIVIGVVPDEDVRVFHRILDEADLRKPFHGMRVDGDGAVHGGSYAIRWLLAWVGGI